MIIDKPKIVEKQWGREEWLCNNSLYCGKLLYVNKDKHCSMHCHKLKTEDLYVLSGSIKLEHQYAVFRDGKIEKMGKIKEAVLNKGESVHIAPCLLHRFTALEENTVLVETSTQHFDSDSHRVEFIG